MFDQKKLIETIMETSHQLTTLARMLIESNAESCVEENVNPIIIFDRKLQENNKVKELIMNKGSISLRKDGRYMGRYYVDGVCKCVYAKDEYECALKLKKAIKESEKKEVSKNMSVRDWLIYYTKYFKQPILKETSFKSYEYWLNRVLETKSKFLDKKIGLITRADVINFIESLPSYKERTLKELKLSFNAAFNEGLMPVNFAQNIEMKFAKINKEQVKDALTEEQITRLLDNTTGVFKYAIEFLLATGLRKGEMLALTWSDIDYDAKTISVNKSYSISLKSVNTPKTESGKRVIPLFKKAQEVLSNFEYRQGVIFKDLQKSLDRNWNAVCKKINLDARIHNLRHTFASRCYALGIDLKVIQGWLGHQDVATTSNVYSHLSEDVMTKSIAKLDTLID